VQYSDELQQAANKYYKYTVKYNNCKTPALKLLLANKRLEYQNLVSELFRKEWKEYCGLEKRSSRYAHNVEIGGSNPPPATNI